MAMSQFSITDNLHLVCRYKKPKRVRINYGKGETIDGFVKTITRADGGVIIEAKLKAGGTLRRNSSGAKWRFAKNRSFLKLRANKLPVVNSVDMLDETEVHS